MTGLFRTDCSHTARAEAVIPNAVGVDIGCGMCAVRTSLTSHDLPDTLKPLRDAIEQAIIGPLALDQVALGRLVQSGVGYRHRRVIGQQRQQAHIVVVEK